MLDNPPHGGKGATPKQHRFFEMIAHGGKPTRVGKRGKKK